jgi:aldose sugar dehydrogenase
MIFTTIMYPILPGVSGQASSQQVINDPNLRAGVVFEGLDFPSSMAFLGPDDILVLEKDKGTVHRIVNGQMLERPLLDVGVASKGERGMLGIAVANVDKNDSEKSYIFLYYTESPTNEDGVDDKLDEEPLGNRVYRYLLDDGQLKDPKLLLDLPADTPKPIPFHNGGKVLIGPDQNVYTVIGDLDSRRTPTQNIEDGDEQDGTSTIYRVNQEGDAAEGNPFTDIDGWSKYYAYGIRNSFGMDFDPLTGNLWDTENGPDHGDEINLVEPGFNSGALRIYGASTEEDKFDTNKLTEFDGKAKYSDPEFTWDVPIGVSDLRFLDSDKYGKEYENDLFVGDVNNGNIYRFDLNEKRTEFMLDEPLKDKIANDLEESNDVIFGKGFGGITDIEVGPDGYLYVLAIKKFHEDNTGTIYRIVPASD